MHPPDDHPYTGLGLTGPPARKPPGPVTYETDMSAKYSANTSANMSMDTSADFSADFAANFSADFGVQEADKAQPDTR